MQRAAAAALACLTLAAPLAGQTLKGSSASVDRQHDIAVQHDFSFLDNTADVRRFVDLGLLVRLSGGSHYELGSVSFPYARPAVRTFVERLSGQYQAACGEPLVVTSLTRPVDRQPRNASDLSVHPAGMAVDLRVSNRRSCRTWLEKTLLSLEKSGVLEATRERRPAHYHVAVFPNQYVAYVDGLDDRASVTLAASSSAGPDRAGQPPAASNADRAAAADAGASAGTTATAAGANATNAGRTPAVNAADAVLAATSAESTGAASTADEAPESTTTDYRVSRGDTLWDIARRVGTTVKEIKQLNGLRSSRLVVGQTLLLPAGNQN